MPKRNYSFGYFLLFLLIVDVTTHNSEYSWLLSSNNSRHTWRVLIIE